MKDIILQIESNQKEQNLRKRIHNAGPDSSYMHKVYNL